MKISLIKSNMSNGSQSVSWVHKDDEVVLSFPFEIHVIYASKINRIVIEKYQEKKISIYTLSGKIDIEVVIPEMKGYQFRGLNKSDESASGVSLLFVPVEPGKVNKWGDIEQYELKIEKDALGKYLNIYR